MRECSTVARDRLPSPDAAAWAALSTLALASVRDRLGDGVAAAMGRDVWRAMAERRAERRDRDHLGAGHGHVQWPAWGRDRSGGATPKDRPRLQGPGSPSPHNFSTSDEC